MDNFQTAQNALERAHDALPDLAPKLGPFWIALIQAAIQALLAWLETQTQPEPPTATPPV